MAKSDSGAISVNHISKRFGEFPALKDISFDVPAGELFGLIGPDGAGKTTLFRILTSLLVADSGTAQVAGLDVVTGFKELRNKIGYMPGKFSLYQDLTMEENLQFFASIFNTTVEENYRLIQAIYCQIEPFKQRRAGKLSGGMKQKLALSCALIHKPVVLFLDEPTTGVDPVSRKEFWEMLRDLKREGITIVVSTPYMDEANLCDRIALIQHGEILSIETPAKIVEQFPKKLYQVESNDNFSLLGELRSNPNVESVYMFGEVLHVMFKGEDAPSPAFTEITPTIEDCFIKIASPPDPSHREGAQSEYKPTQKPLNQTFSRRDSGAVIEVHDLTKRFGNFTAVDHIRFSVAKGEIFGFLGANGAGKTTAMRMLCGLSKPTSGKGFVAGYDIAKQSEQVKRNIGYMSQKFSLYEDLKVWENMRLFAGIYGMPDKQILPKIEITLSELGLMAEKNTLVKALPLGWKQKLAFSIAIFHEPQIVFLDEPTGGVDPITRRQFWELIYEAASRDITVFVTTHYMDEAEYCNRVSIMVDGRIDALDTPKNLRQQFQAENMDEVFRKLARKATRT
ncbi:MAG: putative ABC transporter ATP-binding protein YbhF [Candidatus Ordinivivax streblomastigis]|uniref:Putative ABC transporter ATP-binding protein YbhF n=1 Tax=Candidatus Ordinivivax streblomastigis TaxID=2540710 RepID=A0A5M8P3L7_9BACT|nr:MAG: putative ABC transporter ATP-binding protein YbhF [Candidatus Ordinivivax streblomastigis]